jgi:hypothetical protein
MSAELVKDWHPLDGVPAPEYIPRFWDGVHAGKRLVEGLRILQSLVVPGLSNVSNAWPAYRHEWTDQLAQLEAETEEQKRDAQRRNWTRIVPSAEEIARMEQVIGWPAGYLSPWPQLLKVVQAAAHARVRHRDLNWLTRRLALPARLVRQWNREGLDRIAHGLIRDKVKVF